MKTDQWFRQGPFTFFDIETSGFSPVRDRIVEIAAVKYDTEGNESRFYSLVYAGKPMKGKASSVHRISDKMLCNAPPFKDVAGKFINFAAGSTLVAHNARFDLAFLQESLFRETLQLWEGLTLDSIKIVRTAFPDLPGYSLKKLASYFGLEHDDKTAHMAMSDVELTVKIFSIAIDRLSSNTR